MKNLKKIYSKKTTLKEIALFKDGDDFYISINGNGFLIGMEKLLGPFKQEELYEHFLGVYLESLVVFEQMHDRTVEAIEKLEESLEISIDYEAL